MTVKTEIGNITASKEVLNDLMGILLEASKSYKERGREALAERCDNMFSQMFDCLELKGYYK